MLTQPATQHMLAQWQQVWEQYRPQLRPNRISGEQLLAYLREKYPLLELYGEDALAVVRGNVLDNEPHRAKLPPGAEPQPLCFIVPKWGAAVDLYDAQDDIFRGIDIFVGIDLASGFFLVEGSSQLWDELFAQRGLDEEDLANIYLVAEYVACRQRFGLPVGE